MNHPFYFTDRVLQIGFNITVESLQINHTNSKLISTPNYTELGV